MYSANNVQTQVHLLSVDLRLHPPQSNVANVSNESLSEEPIPDQNPKINEHLQSEKKIQVVEKSDTQSTSTKLTQEDRMQFLDNVMKMGEIATLAKEYLENEAELGKKEKTKLYLKRDEFKRLFKAVKAVNQDVF